MRETIVELAKIDGFGAWLVVVALVVVLPAMLITVVAMSTYADVYGYHAPACDCQIIRGVEK
jgi:hypothetical protein